MEFGASTTDDVTWGENVLKLKIVTCHLRVWDEQAFTCSHGFFCANLKENNFNTKLADA